LVQFGGYGRERWATFICIRCKYHCWRFVLERRGAVIVFGHIHSDRRLNHRGG
jgi:hypothetical protein